MLRGSQGWKLPSRMGTCAATIRAIVSYYVAFSTTVLIAGHYCTNYERMLCIRDSSDVEHVAPECAIAGVRTWTNWLTSLTQLALTPHPTTVQVTAVSMEPLDGS